MNSRLLQSAQIYGGHTLWKNEICKRESRNYTEGNYSPLCRGKGLPARERGRDSKNNLSLSNFTSLSDFLNLLNQALLGDTY